MGTLLCAPVQACMQQIEGKVLCLQFARPLCCLQHNSGHLEASHSTFQHRIMLYASRPRPRCKLLQAHLGGAPAAAVGKGGEGGPPRERCHGSTRGGQGGARAAAAPGVLGVLKVDSIRL